MPPRPQSTNNPSPCSSKNSRQRQQKNPAEPARPRGPISTFLPHGKPQQELSASEPKPQSGSGELHRPHSLNSNTPPSPRQLPNNHDFPPENADFHLPHSQPPRPSTMLVRFP